MGRKPTSPWGIRAADLGPDRVDLAMLAGMTENSVYRGLAGVNAEGVSRGLRSIILAWEIMAPEQRQRWLDRVAAMAASAAGDEHGRDQEPVVARDVPAA